MKPITSILLSALLATSLFAEKQNPSVLVAFESTPYKKALTKELVTLLEKDSIVVTVESEQKEKLPSYSATQFDVVFLSNSGVNSKVRPWIAIWLTTNSEQEAKIILHTTKTKKWDEAVTVDAVSSASKKKNAPADAKLYYDKIIEKLSK